MCSFSRRNRLLLLVKRNNEQTVATIDPETTPRVARNAVRRVNAYLSEGGRHVECISESSC